MHLIWLILIVIAVMIYAICISIVIIEFIKIHRLSEQFIKDIWDLLLIIICLVFSPILVLDKILRVIFKKSKRPKGGERL